MGESGIGVVAGHVRRAHQVRASVLVICTVGIAGMIVTSIADSTSGALAFGLMTAAAIGALFVANFVASDPATSMTEDALVSRIEASMESLGSCDRSRLRRISRDAFELGRRDAPGGTST